MTMMMMHTGHDALALWTHWTTEPAVGLSVLGTAAVYGAGTRRLWRTAGHGRGVRPWQAWCFAAGLLTLAAALMSPIDAMAEDLFSAHMLQHVLLAVVAPPFLVAGAPVTAGLWSLPPAVRQRLVVTARRTRWVADTWRGLTSTATAWAVHGIVLWTWHLPALYTLALRHPVVHAAEHVSFVGTAVLMWWGILHPRTTRRAGYAIGIMILFVTMLHSGALGAGITLSREIWFPVHVDGAAAWGMTALADQQLAGLIMWVPGGLLYLAGMGVLFVAWMRQSARRHALASRAAVAAAAIAAGACGRADASVVPGGDVGRGRDAIAASACGSCHMIPGIRNARGLVGPPLDAIARRTILAGEIANTPENMVRWILDPQAIEPGTAMPNLHLGETTARDIAAYLYTLR